MWAFVENTGDWAERLLASGVPERDFYALAANLHYFGEELDSDCCFLALVELVADVASGDVGFARARWADYNDFKHFVILIHFLRILL